MKIKEIKKRVIYRFSRKKLLEFMDMTVEQKLAWLYEANEMIRKFKETNISSETQEMQGPLYHKGIGRKEIKNGLI